MSDSKTSELPRDLPGEGLHLENETSPSNPDEIDLTKSVYTNQEMRRIIDSIRATMRDAVNNTVSPPIGFLELLQIRPNLPKEQAAAIIKDSIDAMQNIHDFTQQLDATLDREHVPLKPDQPGLTRMIDWRSVNVSNKLPSNITPLEREPDST